MLATPIFALLVASQVFWLRRVWKWVARRIANATSRRLLGWAALAVYLFLFVFNLGWISRGHSPTELTLKAALLEAPFKVWVVGSMVGFLIVALFWIIGRFLRAARWSYQKLAKAEEQSSVSPDPPVTLASPGRRHFLEQAAIAVGSVPFAASAYGLLYERLDIEITRRRIRLARLPKAFEGFRVVQLSDLHIGPFMSAAEIRRCADMANGLKPDLIVLTGDYVTWDGSTQGAAVEALSGLAAPFGVFGCLGNHEFWTETELSITSLFAERGIRILRQARVLLESHGDVLNLIGVDYQTLRRLRMTRREGFVNKFLEGVESLVMPGTANILLSHNPNTFDRAAELGIDLSLAGHTHGGQVTLEFVQRDLTPARLITQYSRGWFERPGGQLYVNRGIGTIAVPIRIGSPPEITVFELVRA